MEKIYKKKKGRNLGFWIVPEIFILIEAKDVHDFTQGFVGGEDSRSSEVYKDKFI